MINRTMYERVFLDIKKYLSIESEFKPVVTKQPKGNKFPKVIIELISNTNTAKDANGFYSHSLVGIEINVYAKPTKELSEMQVAEMIADECSFVCEDIYGMKRTLYSPTPNVDEDVYRLTLRYTAKQNDKRNIFF